MALSQHPFLCGTPSAQITGAHPPQKVRRGIGFVGRHPFRGNRQPRYFSAESRSVFRSRRARKRPVESYLEAIRFLDPEEHDYVYIDIANEYQNNSRFPEAIRYLKKAIRVNAYNDMAYLGTAVLLPGIVHGGKRPRSRFPSTTSSTATRITTWRGRTWAFCCWT